MTRTKSTSLALLAVLLSPILAFQPAMATPITSEVDPSLDGSTLIDFEAIAPGEYASLLLPGATINGIGATMTICTGCGGGGGSFGDVGQSLQNASGSPMVFDIVFTELVSAWGIRGGAFNNNWTYTTYDALDNVIESWVVSNSCCGGFFDGSNGGGIARASLNGFGDWVVFDDLQFVTQSVPEPGTLALFGIGLFGMGLARRKKKV